MKFWLYVFLCFLGASAQAHWASPGYLELKQTSTHSYSVLWKVPLQAGKPLTMAPILPQTCVDQTPVSSAKIAAAVVKRWLTRCEGGLAGQSIVIEGLSSTVTDVLARITRLDGTVQTVRLKGDDSSFEVAESPSWTDVSATYLILGVEHILSGVDHLLFILALLIIVDGWRRLIATITAFTIAHSMTLGAATLGLVYMPRPPVEAVIAVSILFLAMEIARRHMSSHAAADSTAGDPAPTPTRLETPHSGTAFLHQRDSKEPAAVRSLTYHWPWLVAFAFGLLHGFGFAGALSEVGLPQNAIPLALLFFNIGVEIGQLLFVAAFVILRRMIVSMPWKYTDLIEVTAAYTIGGIAAYWTIERVLGFWA